MLRKSSFLGRGANTPIYILMLAAFLIFSGGDLPISAESEAEPGIERLNREPIGGISEYRLKKNGLHILLVERHATPVVMTTMVFHVGSRNEAVGFTGATHFLEHMMFKGTATIDPLKKTGIDDLLKSVGGVNNATTWFDRTNYYELVPPDHLDLCLKIESDRMRNLLLRESDRQAEMTVVRNELEQGEDNPSELLETNLFATAFREHPYHHPTIGWRSDVEGVPTARLKKFYDDFYWPDNATLIVIGDFKSADALNLIAERFGSIPKNPNPLPSVYTREPPQEGERRFVIRRGADLPRLTMGFHIPEAMSADTYPLDLIQAVLGDSSKPSSRLYKRLIDTGLASEVSCQSYSLKDPGLFVVNAQANESKDLPRIEAAILDELKKVQEKPVTSAELSRAKKSITKGLRLDISDPSGLAHHLTEAIACANWQWWLNYPKQIDKVTQEQILKVSRRYFQPDNRTVGYYYPKTKTGKEQRGQAESGAAAQLVGDKADRSSQDSAAEKDHSAVPQAQPQASNQAASTAEEIIGRRASSCKIEIGKRVKKINLANGVTVLVLNIPGSGTVAVSGKLAAGAYFADKQKTAVPDLVAGLLNKGSAHFSKTAIAEALENMGARLDVEPGTYWTGFDTEVVKEDLNELLHLTADVLMKPSFSEQELKLEKSLALADIKQNMADTDETSWNTLMRRLYTPSSPFYQKSFKDQIADLNAITRNDLVSFHARFYKPGNLVIGLVGDISEKEAGELIARHFAAWTGKKRDQITVSANCARGVKEPEKLIVRLPDKANVDVVVGKPLPIDLKSPDYYAALLGNAALGFDSFACRLAPVRDKYGLSYHIASKMEDPSLAFGPWSIKFSVNPKNLKRAENLVESIVGDYLRDGITQDELDVEKSHLSGVFMVQLRSAKQIAAALTSYQMCGVEPTYIDEFAGKLNRVGKEDINAAIRKYFKLNDAVWSISGTVPGNGQRKN